MADSLKHLDTFNDPTGTNAAVQKVLSEGDSAPAPTIAPQPSGFVRLPGGLVAGPGEPVVYDAEVKELTGEDEEYIDRVRSGRPEKFFEAILERGIRRLGEHKPSKTLINELLVGDADYLFLAIRRATYGDTLEYTGFRCPECQELIDVDIDLDDVPVERLENSSDRTFTVSLRNGREAHCRMLKFGDSEVLGDPKMNDAERKTMLLSRVVLRIDVPGTDPILVNGDPAEARRIGVVDRNALLEAVYKRKVGPNYNEVRLTHDSCGKEVFFPVDMGDLFPGL